MPTEIHGAEKTPPVSPEVFADLDAAEREAKQVDQGIGQQGIELEVAPGRIL